MSEDEKILMAVTAPFMICLGLAMVAGAVINDERAFFGVLGGGIAVQTSAIVAYLLRGK